MFSISEFSEPSFNSALYIYTIFYILMPMINMIDHSVEVANVSYNIIK
jgi:hypothetical protein